MKSAAAEKFFALAAKVKTRGNELRVLDLARQFTQLGNATPAAACKIAQRRLGLSLSEKSLETVTAALT